MKFKVGDKVKFKESTFFSFDNIKKARGIVTGIINDNIYIDVINDEQFERGWKSELQPYIGYCFLISENNIVKIKPWWRFWNGK